MDTTPKHLLVEYGRRNYAFGLQWFVAEEDEPARKQALNFIRKSGKDFDLLGERKGEFPQYTVTSTDEGLKAGAIAAASIIAEMMPTESWLYIAEIEDSIWITYGRDGEIMADGDRIYTNTEEAKRVFQGLEPGRWKSLSVPASWKSELFGNADEGGLGSSVEVSELKDIFQKPSRTVVRLESLSSTGKVVKIALLALLLAGVAFAAWQFLGRGPAGPTPEEQAAQAQQLAELARQEQERIFAELDANKPWEQAPAAQAVIAGCLETLRGMPLNPAGYVYESGECTSGTVTASYQRSNSFPTWLREWEPNNPEFQVDIDLETSNAFISTTWDAPSIRGPETLTDYVSMLRFLNESKLLIAGDMSYTQPIEFRYDEYPDYIPLYGTSDLVITTTQPEQWRLALDRLPGIVINTVRRQAETSSYTLEGQIYVSTR